MAQSIKWLFVYGTLLSRSRDRIGRDMRRRLQRSCLVRRPARVPGKLYDLGGYPGWVEQAEGGLIVRGELLLLRDAADVFAWLDPYENYDPATPEEGEYIREVTLVAVASEYWQKAWVYRYRGEQKQHRLLQAGTWLRHPRATR